MSNISFLRYCFGIDDVDYIKTEYKDRAVLFHIKTKEEALQCSKCKSKEVIKKGAIMRQFQTYSIGPKPVYLIAKIQRLGCKVCGAVAQEKIKFADEKKLLQRI